MFYVLIAVTVGMFMPVILFSLLKHPTGPDHDHSESDDGEGKQAGLACEVLSQMIDIFANP